MRSPGRLRTIALVWLSWLGSGVGRAQEAATGIAKIVSIPPGATVSIDGEIIGEAPLTRYVPAGFHVVRVETAQFDPYVRRVEFPADTTLEIRAELKPGGGTVEFVIEPPGTTLVLDGEEWPTPIRLARSPGHYSYRLEAPGFETRTGELDIAEGQNVLLRESLRIAEGLVVLTSEPDGARVRLGEEVLGTTPLTLEALELGPHTFLFDLPGRALATGSVDTTDGSAAAVDAFLVRDGIPVSVRTGKTTARLRVQGVPVGTGELVSFHAAQRTPYELAVEAPGESIATTTLVVGAKDDRIVLRTRWHDNGRNTLQEVRPLLLRGSFWGAAGACVAIAAGGTYVAVNIEDLRLAR